jgi:hypothetical protein
LTDFKTNRIGGCNQDKKGVFERSKGGFIAIAKQHRSGFEKYLVLFRGHSEESIHFSLTNSAEIFYITDQFSTANTIMAV